MDICPALYVNENRTKALLHDRSLHFIAAEASLPSHAVRGFGSDFGGRQSTCSLCLSTNLHQFTRINGFFTVKHSIASKPFIHVNLPNLRSLCRSTNLYQFTRINAFFSVKHNIAPELFIYANPLDPLSIGKPLFIG